MHQDIADYVKSCTRCQMAKRNSNPTKPPMNSMPVNKKIECWQIYILGPLNKSSHGYEYILLCIDAGVHLNFSNMLHIATSISIFLCERFFQKF